MAGLARTRPGFHHVGARTAGQCALRVCVSESNSYCISTGISDAVSVRPPAAVRMSYKATKPGLVSVLYLSVFFIMLLFIRAPSMYC